MRYIAIIISLLFFVFTFFVIATKDNGDNLRGNTEVKERRAIYFSYIEFNSYIKDKNSDASKENIEKALDNIKSLGFNTILLHVRPFSDSIYESEYFPISDTILNDKGERPDYDVLAFFIDEAHKRDIFIEAWINPFRVSNLTDISKVSADSPYYKFVSTGDAKVIAGKGIYLNPASDAVQKLIVDGIEEVVEKYDIDGIHLDDYFYPDKSIDLESYEAYKENGGTLDINEYRLNNISMLIKNIYKTVKDTKKDVLFGIAPEGNIENNYNNSYLDIELILGNEGYIDYIMPQLYYGFKNGVKPFIETLNTWDEMIKVESIKLIPALAFYKTGTEDPYAKEGKNEWLEETDIIKKQIIVSRNANNYSGFSLFRYDYLFNEEKQNSNTKLEIAHIKEVLN